MPNITRFLFLPIILLFSLPDLLAQSHQASITVVDAYTEEPIPFVQIQVENTMRGATTDEQGRATLKVPGDTIVLVFAMVGYRELKAPLAVNSSFDIRIKLIPRSTDLQEIIVRGNDASTELRETVAGVERLSAKEIINFPVAMGEVDIFRAVQMKAGVNSAGEVSNGLSIRGSTIDQNLVLLNGAPIFTPTHLFGLFSVFTPDALGSVDLYKGTIPSRYAGRAAAVMDVKSKIPTDDKFTAAGGVGLVSSRLKLETPLTKNKRLKLLVAGRGSFTDFALRAFNDLQNTESRFADATATLRYASKKNDLFTLSGFYSYDAYQFDLIARFNGIEAEINRYEYSTLNVTADYLKILNDKTSLSFRYVNADHEPQVLFPQLNTDFTIGYRNRIQFQSGRAELNRKEGAHDLLAGVEVQEYRLQPGRLDPGGSPNVQPIQLDLEKSRETGLYLRDEWQIGSGLSMDIGLRLSHYQQLGPGPLRTYDPTALIIEPEVLLSTENVAAGEVMTSYTNLEPRLGLLWEISETSSFKAGYTRAYQYLQNVFNATTPLPTSRWKLTDNNILPQSSHQYTAGYYRTFDEGKYSSKFETYYRTVDNVLDYRPGADFFLNNTVEQYLIQGLARGYGAELTFTKHRGIFTGEVNYAYARAKRQITGRDISSTVNKGRWFNDYFDQPHTLNLNLTMDDERLHKVSLNLVVQSNRPFSIPSGFLTLQDRIRVPLFLERNNDRLPLYHRLDLSWTVQNPRQKKKRWTGEWTVTVYNLLSRDNAYNIYYITRSSERDANIFRSSPLGRYRLTIFGSIIPSVSYNFKFR